MQIVSFNSDADIFLNYIFGKAEKQLRGVLGSMQSSSSAFSNCLAVQLVRGLLLAGTHSADFVAATSSKSGSNTGSSSSGAVSSVWLRSAVPTAASKVADTAGTYPRSQLLEKLAERYRPVGSGATAGDSSTAVATSSTVTGAGAGSDGGGVASIILGMWKYLPFGALHRLFALQAPPDPAGQSTQYLEQHQHQHQPSSLSMPVAVAVENALSLPANPLAERSLDLLLILLHNRRLVLYLSPRTCIISVLWYHFLINGFLFLDQVAICKEGQPFPRGVWAAA